MAIDKAIVTPAEAKLIELVGYAAKRTERAQAKRDAAQREVDAAISGHVAAVKRLEAWREIQPHQRNLPLEEPIS
jgi:hypothetical protein